MKPPEFRHSLSCRMFCRPLMICETSEAKGLTPGTLTQSPGSFAIGGFMASTGPCEPVSFELTGSFVAGGAVTFKANAPRPPQGPCPGGRDVEFSGTFTNTNRLISARGVTRVQCPEFGEHVFTYLVTASR